jgi:hypothetical protein
VFGVSADFESSSDFSFSSSWYASSLSSSNCDSAVEKVSNYDEAFKEVHTRRRKRLFDSLSLRRHVHRCQRLPLPCSYCHFDEGGWLLT